MRESNLNNRDMINNSKMSDKVIRWMMIIGLGISVVNLLHKPDYNLPLFVALIYIWQHQKESKLTILGVFLLSFVIDFVWIFYWNSIWSLRIYSLQNITGTVEIIHNMIIVFSIILFLGKIVLFFIILLFDQNVVKLANFDTIAAKVCNFISLKD